jgi:ferric-dicitrate binding protein FerR (iron transport regulator)
VTPAGDYGDDSAEQRFFAGQVTPDEEAAFRAAYEAAGGDPATLDAGRAAFQRLMHPRSEGDVNRLWRDLERRLDAPGPAVDAPKSPTVQVLPVHRHSPWRVAAMIALVATTGAGVWGLLTKGNASRMESFVVPRGGALRTVYMPDGTRFVLAPASQLTYDAARFGTRERVVTLIGQASFSVVHHDDRPFTVRAGPLVTRDVGTEFTVRAYPDAPARVAVAEGSVIVNRPETSDADRIPTRSASSPILLTAGMAATTPSERDAAGLRTGPADPAMDFGWTTDGLAFHNVPLRDVVAALSRTSDVDMTVAGDSLSGLEVNVAFHTETPDQACAMLALLAHAKCRRSGHHITLSSR